MRLCAPPLFALLLLSSLSWAGTEPLCRFVIHPSATPFNPSTTNAIPQKSATRLWIEKLLALGFVHRGSSRTIDDLSTPVDSIELREIPSSELPESLPETNVRDLEQSLRDALEPILGIQFSRFPLRSSVERFYRSLYAEAARMVLNQAYPADQSRRLLRAMDARLLEEAVPFLPDFESLKHFVQMSDAEPDLKERVIWNLELAMVKGSRLNASNEYTGNNQFSVRKTKGSDGQIVDSQAELVSSGSLNYPRFQSNRDGNLETNLDLASRYTEARTTVTLARIVASDGQTIDLKARVSFGYVVTSKGEIRIFATSLKFKNRRIELQEMPGPRLEENAPVGLTRSVIIEDDTEIIGDGNVQITLVRGTKKRR